VVVIGGGDSAVEEALFITRFASRITLIHRGAALRANKTAQARAFAEPKMRFVLEHAPREFRKNADGTMTVVVEDLQRKAPREITADGVFVFTGMRPNLSLVNNRLELDAQGYVKTDHLMHTNMPDVFAVGDMASKIYRQITIAVAEGTVAAITAAKEIERNASAS
jgi:thioredoxin reductase (NADPH)